MKQPLGEAVSFLHSAFLHNVHATPIHTAQQWLMDVIGESSTAGEVGKKVFVAKELR